MFCNFVKTLLLSYHSFFEKAIFVVDVLLSATADYYKILKIQFYYWFALEK